MTRRFFHKVGGAGRGRRSRWTLFAIGAVIVATAECAPLALPAAQATTAPSNSIDVHVELTDSGVKLIRLTVTQWRRPGM